MSQTEYSFDFSGGQLALDFVNTVGGMRGVNPREHLHAYDDLVAFARQAGVLSDRDAARLRDLSARRAAEAAQVLAAAKALRESLYELFVGASRGEVPTDEALAPLNRALGRALAHRRVMASGGALSLGWEEGDALDAVVWPMADAAAALLVSADLTRLRVCGMYEDEECSWLFLDRTKARTRRWCSMKDCGNRAKARRHQARHRRRPA